MKLPKKAVLEKVNERQWTSVMGSIWSSDPRVQDSSFLCLTRTIGIKVIFNIGHPLENVVRCTTVRRVLNMSGTTGQSLRRGGSASCHQ